MTWMGVLLAVMLLASPSLASDSPEGKWTGVSTGDEQSCRPLTFAIEIREGRITGEATSRRGRAPLLWDVSGSVGPSERVEIVTQTRDSRVQSHRQRIRWVGRLESDVIELEQPKSIGCNATRRATLKRQ